MTVTAALTVGAAALILAFELQNVLAWWRGRTVSLGDETSDDFTILVPVFGHPRYFAGRHRLARYRARTVVALETSAVGMEEFADRLEREGWRVCRLVCPAPNPSRLISKALDEVATTYTLRLDADTEVVDDVRRVVAAVAADGAELCSVKVEAARPRTVPARLQALEYRMAMLSRHYRPWLASGACFVGRTDALRTIFGLHSLWSPGEDIEMGRVAHALRLRVRHVDATVRTDVPETWTSLFRQRRLWWAGSFRHWFVNLDRNLLQLPLITLYYAIAIWFAVSHRFWNAGDLGTIGTTLPLVLLVYALVTAVANLRVLSPWMIVFPVYAFAQSLVMPAVGAVYYVVLASRAGYLGRYRFGLRRRSPPRPLPPLPRRTRRVQAVVPRRAAVAPRSLRLRHLVVPALVATTLAVAVASRGPR